MECSSAEICESDPGMGCWEDQEDRQMRIRLEREARWGGEVTSRVAVEIESDDPSWAMRKAHELLDKISGEADVKDQGEAGADGL